MYISTLTTVIFCERLIAASLGTMEHGSVHVWMMRIGVVLVAFSIGYAVGAYISHRHRHRRDSF